MTQSISLAAAPACVRDLTPTEGVSAAHGVCFTVINFNTAAQTLRCVASLVACDEPPDWVLVLDNASVPADFAHLSKQIRSGPHTLVRLYRSETNLGFAAGSNFLIDCSLDLSGCTYIGLLNNDAVALPPLIGSLRTALNSAATTGMAGGRMHRLASPEAVDTLGIALYRSLMPADRMTTDVPFLGPTGGCCLMTRAFVDDVVATTGYCFDARFFCYCEDTDLVLRANLLGYRPAYVDALLALHEGQASTGGRHNHFIAYHGLRNAMWMQWKLMPPAMRWRHAPQLGLAHLLTIVRQILSGRARLLWTIYRDAWGQRATFLAEQRRLSQLPRVNWNAVRQHISPHFYRQGYASVVIAEWKARWFGRA